MKILFLSVVIAFSFSVAAAQSLAGLRIGDNETALVKLGSPAATDRYKTYVVRKWKLADANELSVTVDHEGKIVYLESDWGGSGEASGRGEVTESDLHDLRFGVTRLSDLRMRFGSNGLMFKERGGVQPIADGVVMLNSYEVGNSVVTFFTVAGAFAGKGSAVAERAKLNAISIADAQYATSEWGDRVYDPGYKKIEWT